MADEPKGGAHLAGAGIMALLGSLAMFADDCGRVGRLAGAGVVDDLGRGATFGDDLARGGAFTADDLARGGALSDDVGFAGGLDDVRLSGLPDEAASVAARDAAIAEIGFVDDVSGYGVDLAQLGLEIATRFPPDALPAPHLVVEGRDNEPPRAPPDPLVLVVDDDDEARVQRVARRCAGGERTCVVVACPPRGSECLDAWAAGGPKVAVEATSRAHGGAVAGTLVITARADGALEASRVE